MPGWYRVGWWNATGINCTAEEMRDGLEQSMAFAVTSVFTSNLSREIVSGKVKNLSKKAAYLFCQIYDLQLANGMLATRTQND